MLAAVLTELSSVYLIDLFTTKKIIVYVVVLIVVIGGYFYWRNRQKAT